MIFNKDQAAKLRSLAEKEGIGKKEETLTYSSLIEDKPGRKIDNVMLTVILAVAILFLIALGVFLLGQNDLKYRQVVDSMNKQSEALRVELSSLNSKTNSLKSELTENIQRNSGLSEQVMSLNIVNSGLKNKLGDIEKERSVLAKEIMQAQQKAAAMEAEKKELQSVLQKQVSGLEAKITQLSSKIEQAKSAVVEGEVIFINKENQFAVINLGKNRGLDKGMFLDIISGDAVIGQLEVVEARQDVSACNIKTDFNKLSVGLKVRLK
jgi:uncharacterized protein YlxW (UPF0749 family)